MKAKKLFNMFILMLLAFPFVLAQDGFEDPEIFGLEVEKLLFLVSASLALALAILTLIAYLRTKKSRLIFITSAFFLFSVKLFLLSLGHRRKNSAVLRNQGMLQQYLPK